MARLGQRLHHYQQALAGHSDQKLLEGRLDPSSMDLTARSGQKLHRYLLVLVDQTGQRHQQYQMDH
jgi:hypothetical protein